MSIEDAARQNSIVENLKSSKSRSLGMLQELRDNLEQSDADSCILLCTDILTEVQKEILHVPTETFNKSTENATKSTVKFATRDQRNEKRVLESLDINRNFLIITLETEAKGGIHSWAN